MTQGPRRSMGSSHQAMSRGRGWSMGQGQGQVGTMSQDRGSSRRTRNQSSDQSEYPTPNPPTPNQYPSWSGYESYPSQHWLRSGSFAPSRDTNTYILSQGSHFIASEGPPTPNQNGIPSSGMNQSNQRAHWIDWNPSLPTVYTNNPNQGCNWYNETTNYPRLKGDTSGTSIHASQWSQTTEDYADKQREVIGRRHSSHQRSERRSAEKKGLSISRLRPGYQ